MAAPSAGLSRDARAPSTVAGSTHRNIGAPVDTTQLDRLVEKALIAGKSCRHALAASFHGRAADEALLLHGETFVNLYLTLQRAGSLLEQACLEGVTHKKAARIAKATALTTSCLPLLIRRMDENTMLPGRGTAVELAFVKRFTATKYATSGAPPLSTRDLQLVGLSLGYATAIKAADFLLCSLRHDTEEEAFVLRVVDCILPAARSLADFCPGEEIHFASTMQRVLSDALFASTRRLSPRSVKNGRLRRWCRCTGNVACWMHQSRSKKWSKKAKRAGADVAEHGLKHCALPSCDKREASVQQFKCCSACRSVSYCSEEHGVLHWKEHMPICRATMAAQQAAADAGAGAV